MELGWYALCCLRRRTLEQLKNQEDPVNDGDMDDETPTKDGSPETEDDSMTDSQDE